MIKKLYKILEEPEHSKYGFLVQKIILMNLLINIFSFSLPYFLDLDKSITNVLNILNDITVIIFIIELLSRYIVIGVNPGYKGFVGRIKFTFNFYTIIDIISIIPFILNLYNINTSYLKLLRFIRLLKFIRMKHTLRRFINVHYFASSNVFIQSFILFLISVLIIYIFSYGYHSIKHSAAVFLDPPQISEFETPFDIFIGIIELLLGLFIGGALISIITSSFLDIIETVKKGHAPYKNDNHIIIINKNSKLEFILKEINQYYLDEDIHQDIVILVRNEELEKVKEKIDNYSYLKVFILTGDILNWISYDRLNINKAQKVIILNDNDSNISNENEKISTYILSNPNFKNYNLEFIIEVNGDKHIKYIYNYIFKNTKNRYLLVNHEDIIEKFLNRSVIDYNYFKIYYDLLSFSDGFEFYILNYDDVFEEDYLYYFQAYMKLENSILIGIVDKNKVILNPLESVMLNQNHKLIVLMKSRFDFEINEVETLKSNNLKIPLPKLKEQKNICIIGDYNDISLDNIVHFLDDKSKENITHIVEDNYMNKNLWDKLLKLKIDIIILNLEDEEEFILTMFLKSLYSEEELVKLVNIFYNPQIASLLLNTSRHNLILSDEIIGKFITQNLFNMYANDIFDEITQTKGNELYILKKDEYEKIYNFDYQILKHTLYENNMLYIGGFIDKEFYFNYTEIEKIEKIVVLARGIL